MNSRNEQKSIREASEWMVRLRDEQPSVDLAEFQAWVDADPANATAFEKMAAALETIGAHQDELRAFIDQPSPPRRAPSRRALVGAGLALAASIGLFLLWPDLSPTMVYATRTGEYRQVALNDGSRLSLNAATELSVEMIAAQRLVRLARGEAYFEVAGNAERPFVVEADGERVEAIGTAFAVRIDEGRLLVTVREGEVVVRQLGLRSGRTQRVSAGERFERQGDNRVLVRISDYDIGRSLVWREGMLWFDGEALHEVADEVARHTGARFIIDPDFEELAITAYIRASNLDGLAASIEETYPDIVVRRRGNEVRIERRAGPRQ